MHFSTLSAWRRFFGVAGLLLTMGVLSPSGAQAQTWQVSTVPYVQLGVADKFGQLGTYSARFVVTNKATGKEYVLVKEVPKGQNGIDVVFPSMPTEYEYFKTERGEAATAQPGSYTWQCQVGGKKVVGGQFEIAPAANDVTYIEKAR